MVTVPVYRRVPQAKLSRNRTHRRAAFQRQFDGLKVLVLADRALLVWHLQVPLLAVTRHLRAKPLCKGATAVKRLAAWQV